MPLFYLQHINNTTRLAIWKIEEEEDFFSLGIPLKNEITHCHKRLQHLAGRYLLPFLYPDFPTEEIEIADTRKPFLINEKYHFSISHCADYAAAIVSSDCRVGIDVEVLNPKIISIKHKFLHPEELDFVNRYEQEDQKKLLGLAWSAKEAMFKWYGLGQVDFREMMRLAPFDLADNGIIQARFVKASLNQPLLLHYNFFKRLVLAWVVN